MQLILVVVLKCFVLHVSASAVTPFVRLSWQNELRSASTSSTTIQVLVVVFLTHCRYMLHSFIHSKKRAVLE